jgi:hypothetical protein
VSKSLYWKGSDEADHVWVESVVHGQCREMALYGEEVYDQYCAKVRSVLVKSNAVHFASPMKTFDEQMQHYAEAICTCYVARDLTRDRVAGVPVYHYNHQFAPRLDLMDKFVVRAEGVHFRAVQDNYQPEEHGLKVRISRVESEYVFEEWNAEMEKEYLARFPDPKKGVRTSLHRVGTVSYVPPPAGR